MLTGVKTWFPLSYIREGGGLLLEEPHPSDGLSILDTVRAPPGSGSNVPLRLFLIGNQVVLCPRSRKREACDGRKVLRFEELTLAGTDDL